MRKGVTVTVAVTVQSVDVAFILIRENALAIDLGESSYFAERCARLNMPWYKYGPTRSSSLSRSPDRTSRSIRNGD